MKTIKQVADELHIPKQRLYRYIKSHHINDIHQVESTMYIDDILENKLKQHFKSTTTSSESHQNTSNDAVIDTLMIQLKKKDEQIEKLQQLLDQEQQLHLQTQNKLLLLEHKEEEQQQEEKKGFCQSFSDNSDKRKPGVKPGYYIGSVDQ